MSISTQITELNNNINDLKSIKQDIKKAINTDFNVVTNEKLEDYADIIKNTFETYKDYISFTETEQATEITVNDAMEYSKNKIKLFGNTEQATNIITYTCIGTESGDYYFTYNNIKYQFTMPTISANSVLAFNTDTLKLYLGDTEISTITDNTGILITMTDTSNSSYPQTIHNVSGHNEFLIQNKNIWNKDNVSFIDGILDDNGEPSPSVVSHYTNNYVKVEPNTSYTFWGQMYSSSTVTKVYFYTKNKEWISRDAGVTNLSVYNFITPINCYYIRVQCAKVVTLKTGDVQLEKGTTATSYVPHEEQTAEFTLSANQKMFLGDYLADDGIHHVKASVVLKGNEDFTKDNLVFKISDVFPSNVKLRSAYTKAFSNNYLYKYYQSAVVTSLQNNEFTWNGMRYFMIRNDNYETADDFKAYLTQQYQNGTPVIIEYELENEIVEPYTELQQTQYNALKRIMTYSPQTNITVTSADLKPIMTLSYKKIENNE